MGGRSGVCIYRMANLFLLFLLLLPLLLLSSSFVPRGKRPKAKSPQGQKSGSDETLLAIGVEIAVSPLFTSYCYRGEQSAILPQALHWATQAYRSKLTATCKTPAKKAPDGTQMAPRWHPDGTRWHPDGAFGYPSYIRARRGGGRLFWRRDAYFGI